jgi:hypothetical protein
MIPHVQVDPDLVVWLSGHANVDITLKTEIMKCSAETNVRLCNFQMKASSGITIKELREDIADLTGMSKGAADVFAMCLLNEARSKVS